MLPQLEPADDLTHSHQQRRSPVPIHSCGWQDGDLYRRKRRGYRYVEERELSKPPSNGSSGYAYWAETLCSGIYASRDEALCAARSELDWLTDVADRKRAL